MMSAMSPLPIGPEVDSTPRPLPARLKLRGTHVELEPLHRRHAEELWRAAQAGEAKGANIWAFLGYGPVPTRAATEKFVAEFPSPHDPMAWAVRPVATGVVTGWLTLMDIQPKNAAIELGNI